MKRDIAIAGFVLTLEEWQALDPASRAQLVLVANRDDEPWIASGATAALVDPQPVGERAADR